MLIFVGKSKVEVDVAGTRAAYKKLSTPGPEECGCTYCRNWAVQRTTVYPDAVKRLLRSMGIEPGWETEVWQAPWADGRHYYSGWYPFIGKIMSKSDDPEKIENMELWLSVGLSYSVPWLSSEGVQEIHFSCVADWMLDEPPETEPPHAAVDR